MDKLEAAVQHVLPALSNELLKAVVKKLYESGVEGDDDLQYVEETDLSGILKPIQCRKLMSAWKSKDKSSVVVETPSSVSQTHAAILDPIPGTSRTARLPTDSQLWGNQIYSPSKTDWPETFPLPWDKMPQGITTAIQNRRRPSTTDRRMMVRILVDSMQNFDKNPNRVQCTIIAKRIVSGYPETFADLTDEGEKLGSGHYSLLMQLKTRIEHVNRNNTATNIRRKRARKSQVSDEEQDSTVSINRGPVDTYGCVNWQPGLPDNESEESLKTKQTEMLEIFHREGPDGASSDQVAQLMKETYYAQRCAINATDPVPAIISIKQEWPFLFNEHLLCAHFEMLTGISVSERLTSAINKKEARIRSYFRSLGKHAKSKVSAVINDVEAALLEVDDPVAVYVPGMILMLMAHFGEKEDSLFMQADITASDTDIEESLNSNLIESPRLIVQGSSILVGTKYSMAIEGKVICSLSARGCFLKGLAVLFASYYVFNLEYQEEASTTLEFIQRCFLQINPDSGSKCTKSNRTSKKTGKTVQRKRETVSPHITTFLNNLAHYEWKSC